MDLDEEYEVTLIKEVRYDPEDKVFYILTNMMKEKLGFYIFRIKEIDPYKFKFLIKWRN